MVVGDSVWRYKRTYGCRTANSILDGCRHGVGDGSDRQFGRGMHRPTVRFRYAVKLVCVGPRAGLPLLGW